MSRSARKLKRAIEKKKNKTMLGAPVIKKKDMIYQHRKHTKMKISRNGGDFL